MDSSTPCIVIDITLVIILDTLYPLLFITLDCFGLVQFSLFECLAKQANQSCFSFSVVLVVLSIGYIVHSSTYSSACCIINLLYYSFEAEV